MEQTINDLMFPVETRPIVHGGEPSGHQKVIRSDTKELISITSDKYLLIKNKKVIDSVMNYFGDKNLDLQPRKVFTNNSSSRLELVVDKEHSILNDDAIKPMISIVNSYDTTQSLSLSLNAYRLVCSNGMMMMTSVFSSSTKHIGESTAEEVVDNMLGSLDNLNTNFIEMLSSFEEMANTEINDNIKNKFTNAIMNKAIPKYVQDALIQEVVKIQPNNVWELYNCVTYITSHNLDFNKASSNMIESRLNKEIAELF